MKSRKSIVAAGTLVMTLGMVVGCGPAPGPTYNYTLAPTESSVLMVGEPISFTLKDPKGEFVVDDFVIVGQTATDTAKFTYVTGRLDKIVPSQEGELKVFAQLESKNVAALTLTIEKSNRATIKEALDAGILEAPCNGNAGKDSNITTSAWTITGKVVALGSFNSSKVADVIMDDGTEIIDVQIYNSGLSYGAIEVGKIFDVTVKLTNYYGVLEGCAVSSKTGESCKQLYVDNFIEVIGDITPAAPTVMTGAQFDAYNAVAINNGKAGATAYTSIKPVIIDVESKDYGGKDGVLFDVKDGTEGTNYLPRISLDHSLSSLVDETPGLESKLTGYLLGYNSSYKYSNATINEQAFAPVTSVTITGDSAITIRKNEQKQLTATYLPAKTKANITWVSDAPQNVSVDAETGVIRGVTADGTATIKAVCGNVESNGVTVTVSGEAIPCTSFTLEETKSIQVGTTGQLAYTLTPENTTDQITFTSSNTDVAEVSGTGLVTAKALGTSVVTMTVGTLAAQTCTVTVRPQKLVDIKVANVDDPVDLYGYYMTKNAQGSGYYISDGAYGSYVYAAAPTPASGSLTTDSIIHVVGKIGNYSGCKQIVPTSAEIVDAAPETAGLEHAVKLVIDEAKVGNFSEEDHGKLAVVSGVVASRSKEPAAGTNDVTYAIKVAEGKEVKVFLHKKNNDTAAYNDFANKVTVGASVTVEGYVTANKYNGSYKDVTQEEYQLVLPKCTSTEKPDPTSITLNKTSVELYGGQTEQLTATLAPVGCKDVTVVWSVENNVSGKVTVDQTGLVSVASDVTEGDTATIKATVQGTELSATCAVTCKAQAVLTGITIEGENSVKVDSNITLTAKPIPEAAILDEVTWSVTEGASNVSLSSTTGVSVDVTGLVEGTAKIKAICSGFNAEITITVTPKIASGVIYTFNGTRSTTALTVDGVKNALTKGDGDAVITNCTAVKYTYLGANGGSGDAAWELDNCLKLGKGSGGAGSVTFTIDSTKSFRKIIVKVLGWSDSTTLKVGDVSKTFSNKVSKTSMTPIELEFDVASGMTSLEIQSVYTSGNNSVLITSIQFVK